MTSVWEQLADPVQTRPGQLLGASGVVGQHNHDLAVADRADRIGCVHAEEPLDGRQHPAAEPVAVLLHHQRHHAMLLVLVVAEVAGPAQHLVGVAALARQQPLDKILAGPGRRRGDHALATEDHPANGGGMLGDQHMQAIAQIDGALMQSEQVSRHVVTDQNRRDDHRRALADVRGTRGTPRAAGDRENLREPRMHDPLPHRLLPSPIGRSSGQHGHLLVDHGDGGVHPFGDQLGDRVDPGVLRGQRGQVAVHRDEPAQGCVLAADLVIRHPAMVKDPRFVSEPKKLWSHGHCWPRAATRSVDRYPVSKRGFP